MPRSINPDARKPQLSRTLVALAAALGAAASLAGCIALGEEWGAHDTARMGQGQALAQARCAGCHTIAGRDPSPNAKAPSFAAIGERYSRRGLERELQAINDVGHYAMPKTPLSAAERENIAAYIYKGRAGP